MAQAGPKPITSNDNWNPAVTRLIPRPTPAPVLPRQSAELAILTAILAQMSFKKQCKVTRRLREASEARPESMTLEAALNYVIRAKVR